MLKALIGPIHSGLVLGRRIRVLAHDLSALVPPDARVLDVGTGNGGIAHLMEQGRPDIAVEGIDVLVRGKTHIPVRPFDGVTIPYADKSMDVVMFADVLHHTQAPMRLLQEAARVARTAVILKDHLAETPLDRATLRFMDWVGNAPHGVVLPYNYASFATWTQWFGDAHLEIDRFSRDVALYPWPLSALFGRSLHFIARLRPAA